MDLSAIKLRLISFFQNFKIIYLAAAVLLIIIVEVAWAYRTLSSKGSLNITVQNIAQTPLQTAQNIISLNTDKKEYKVGEKILVSINILSNKNTAGTDLIIKYDPNLLAVVTNTAKIPVATGAIYDDYPVYQADEENGIMTISGTTSKTTGVIPNGVFGTITFQGKAVGNARVFLEFAKNATNDTNLIENQSAQDVLEEVKNLDLKITP